MSSEESFCFSHGRVGEERSGEDFIFLNEPQDFRVFRSHPSMTTHNTEAMILQTKDYGESDRVVSFLTRTGGRLNGIAKGARRSQKRFVHAFEPGSLVELTYRERRSLAWIEACKLLEPHLGLRVDVERWGYGALISEILLEMVPEAEPHEELFYLVKEAFGRMTGDRDPVNVLLLFLIRFLDLTGYLPSLDGCGACGKPLREGKRWHWDLPRGILTCPVHSSGRSNSLFLDLGTLRLIGRCRTVPVDKMWRLRILQGKKMAVLRALTGWIQEYIGKDLKSLRLLDQVRAT